MPSAPVIGFSNFLGGNTAPKKECTEDIGYAYRTLGFFQIFNHPIPLACSRRFQSVQEGKLKLDKWNQFAFKTSIPNLSPQTLHIGEVQTTITAAMK